MVKPIISKITSKGQTTVPQEVRTVLKSKPGDLIAWEIDDKGDVSVRSVQSVDIEYLRAVEKTMSEWGTAEDEAAYGDL